VEFLDVVRKGQASIEYLAVFAIALALSTPFILQAQKTMTELRTGSENMQLQNSLEKLETSVKSVSASGEPARRTFQMDVPSNVVSARIEGTGVRYTVDTPSGESDILVDTGTQFSAGSSVPSIPGKYTVTVYMQGSEAVLEVSE
jgi:hypothetical protein